MNAVLPARPMINRWGRARQFIGSPLGAFTGGLMFALWAAFANRDHGLLVSIRSFCGQLFSSTFLTFVDCRVMDSVFARCGRNFRAAAAAAAVSLLSTYGLMISVHAALGTPHILLTLLPGVIPTVGFALMYPALLLRERRA